MITTLLFVLALLQVKHWYVDFVHQSDEEIKHKGIYGNWLGLKHSVKHGVGTFVVLMAVTGWENVVYAVALALLDTVAHYHIDWAKMNFGNRDIQTPQFWNHLGLDQMAHQLCYLLIAGLVVV